GLASEIRARRGARDEKEGKTNRSCHVTVRSSSKKCNTGKRCNDAKSKRCPPGTVLTTNSRDWSVIFHISRGLGRDWPDTGQSIRPQDNCRRSRDGVRERARGAAAGPRASSTAGCPATGRGRR